jgi:hypothetical protein
MIKSFWDRAGRRWCTLMHRAPMWPTRGHYRCSVCLRQYPVSWAQVTTAPAGTGRLPSALERAVPGIG